MGKPKVPREVTASDVHCLENIVVAYNTMFLMSSIFMISMAGTVRELFAEFCRLLSPSVILMIIGGFIVVTATLGYVGIAKKSSSIISLYTMLLVFVLVWEISAGFGILSFRREIRSVVSTKMKKALANYHDDPFTANLVDYAQLELRCCGVSSFRDWDDVWDLKYPTNCRISDISLPPSCCSRFNNSVIPVVNRNGCLPSVDFLFYRSAVLLTTSIIAICAIQVLGAYFSHSLATTLSKYKAQVAAKKNEETEHYDIELPPEYNEKSNYF